jgi:hypothetical protein
MIRDSKEAIIPYYTVPVKTTKWILSFLASPVDFVRARAVCEDWNTLLGELFFGTVTATKNELLRMVHIIQFIKIPFMLTRSTLKLSVNTINSSTFRIELFLSDLVTS